MIYEAPFYQPYSVNPGVDTSLPGQIAICVVLGLERRCNSDGPLSFAYRKGNITLRQ